MEIQKEEQHTVQMIEITAPISGQTVPLGSVPDDTFAGGHMGSGIAIEPAEGSCLHLLTAGLPIL